MNAAADSLAPAIADLIARCRAAGVALAADGGNLRVKLPAGGVAPELVAGLRAHKPAILELLRSAAPLGAGAIPSAAHRARAPLSFGQEGMWLAHQLSGGDHMLNFCVVLELSGELDVAALRGAVNGVVARHAPLRTLLPQDESGKPWQRVMDAAPIELRELDLAALDATARAAAAEAALDAAFREPFDLERDAQCRALLLRLGQRDHRFALITHHITSDGWSVDVLLRELAAFYNAARRGVPPKLAPLPIEFVDYAIWEQANGDSSAFRDGLEYWRRRLEGAPPVHSLPLDRARAPAQTRRSGRHECLLPRPLLEEVESFARSRGITLFVLLMTTLGVLAARLSRERDVVIGTPIANRLRAELAPLIGLFVNVLAIRFEFGDESVDELLRRAQRDYLADIGRQSIPFDRVVAQHSASARSRAYAPLVQLMFVLHNNELGEVALDGLDVGTDFRTAAASQYDLAIAANETPDGLRFVWEYAADLFNAPRVERLSRQFAELLRGMVRNPARSPFALSVEDLGEVSRFGHPPDAFEAGAAPTDVLTAILAHARATPDARALVAGDDSVSYGALLARAERLASRLRREHSIGSGDAVGVALAKSIDAIVAMLAVLAVRGVYVPLDADMAAARLEFCARDARLRVVLGEGPRRAELDDSCAWMTVESASDAVPPVSWSGMAPSGDEPAYVIYTSGSTGEPKGVVVGRRALALHISAMRAVYGISRDDRVLQFASLSFDASLEQVFVALCAGAQLHLRADRELAVAEFADGLRRAGITFADLPVAYARELAAELAARPSLTARLALRMLVIGGEVLPAALVREWRALPWPHRLRMFNAYGPTEAVITSCIHEVGDDVGEPLPIGRAVGGRRLLVLDERQVPCPVGAIGELWIGGEALALEYLGRPELTADRFRVNHEGERRYCSGDLAFWREDGELAFVGRADRQMKVRGFRIEPGEIESALRRHDALAEVAVARHDERLVAWLVSRLHATRPDDEELRSLLGRLLPRYMIPSAFVWLERLPVNGAGKLDAKRLPPPPDVVARAPTHSAPTTPMELALATLWKEVLGRESVGIDDNFFSLGGDSIQAIQVVARAARQGLVLSTQLLFEHQSIRALAPRVKTGARVVAPQHELSGTTVLLPAQRQFLEESDVETHHFNQALLLVPPVSCDRHALANLLQALYRRHDALRLVFDDPMHATARFRRFEPAMVEDALAAPMVFVARDADDFSTQLSVAAERAQRSLDPRTGRLLCAQWVDGGPDHQRLLLVIHHLAVDGVSWRVLLEDLLQAWGQYTSGEEIALDGKTSSVQQWGARLLQFAHEPRLLAQHAFWLDALAADARLPRELPAPDSLPLSTTEVVHIVLDAEFTRELLGRCHEAWNTRVNDLLLAALWKALAEFSGSARVAVMLEGHGREPLSSEIDLGETVGWFTSTFPVPLAGDLIDVGATIRMVKERLRAIPDNGLGYGVLRYLARDEAIVVAEKTAPPEVVFNYLGQFDGLLPGDAAFALAEESVGALHSPSRPRVHRLGFNGMVRGGCLRLELDYSREQYRAETMHALAASVERALREVIAACLAMPRGGRTPSDYPLARVTQTELDAWRSDFAPWSKLYDATLMQQGLLFHSVLDEGRGAYNAQTALELGSLDVRAFKKAWQQLVQRFDVLRTAFVGVDRGARQLVLDRIEVSWNELDWRVRDELSRRRDWLEMQRADLAQGFDIAAPPLMRLTLVRIADDRYYFLWTHHHMILDGWCMPIVFGDLFALYRAEVAGTEARLPDPVPYQHYLGWLRAQDHDAARAWWRASLAQVAEPTSLGLERANPQAGAGADAWLALDVALSERLRSFARGLGITQSALVQAAWAYLLYRYSGERRVTFGATVSGRPADLVGVEQCVGLFINTLPVSVDVDPSEDLAVWLSRLHAAGLERDRYNYLSLAEIQKLAPLPRGTALFDSLLVFESYPVDVEVANQVFGGRAAAGSFSIDSFAAADPTHYGLTLVVVPGDEWRFRLSYDSGRYDAQIADGVLRHLGEVLRSFADAAAARGRAVRDLRWLPAHERREIPARWNDTERDFGTWLPVHELIARRAAALPTAIALEFGDVSMTYGDLDVRANRLANLIAGSGVGPGDVVGVCLPRSPELVVSLLGIHKAGAAYLPLDPDYPRARLAHMLEDAAPRMVLGIAGTLASLPDDGTPRLDWSDAGFLAALGQTGDTRGAELVARAMGPGHLAYIIYTSGSTGRPKGVLVEHASVTNFLLSMLEEPGIAAVDRLLAVTSTSFDIHVLEIFAPLVAGGTVIVAGQEEYADPRALERLLAEHRVSVMQATPSTWLALVESGWQPAQPLKVLCGGEPLPASLRQKLLARPGVELWNMYGPTETCVWSAAKRIEDEILIGLPIANTRFHVLDAHLEPMPVGAVGDLYIGGAGLARGYHRRPELTSAAFITAGPDLGGERLYRSGDRVRRRANGELEFVGRADQQVKIRGFRIEIGEVVDALECLAEVRQAAVVVRVRPGEDRYLSASVVLADGAVSSAAIVARQLAERLPQHMIPARIEFLDALPQTPNGKVDLKVLASHEEIAAISSARLAPATPIERELCALWRELLALPPDAPGVDEDLIELGADSIRVLMFVGRAAKRGIEVRARDVYRCRHVRALAAAAATASSPRAHGQYEGDAALTADQCEVLNDERVWRRFYINCVFDLAQPVDLPLLQRALDELCGLHDALRARFVREAGCWRQRIVAGRSAVASAASLGQAWEDEGAVARLRELLEHVQRGLSIEQGPTVYLLAVSDNRGVQKLLLTVSHLVADGFSMSVMLDDLFEIYAALVAGEARRPRHGLGIDAWAPRYRELVDSPGFRAQLVAWETLPWHLATPLPLDRPAAFHDGSNTCATSACFARRYDTALTTALQTLPLRSGIATPDFLNIVLARAVMDWGGVDAVALDIFDTGRGLLQESLDIDLSRTVGAFALRRYVFLERASLDEPREALRQLHSQLARQPHRGAGVPLLRRVCDDAMTAARARALPASPVWFNYAGVVDDFFKAGEGDVYPKPSALMGSIEAVTNHPETQRRRVFCISGQIAGGQLELVWEYSRALHEEASVLALADSFAAELVRSLDALDRDGSQ